MMIALSWVGTVFIIAGLWLQGGKAWWALLFSLVGEAAWIGYAVGTQQWSLAVVCAIFEFIYVRNIILWRQSGTNEVTK